jgi:hypothetical protein
MVTTDNPDGDRDILKVVVDSIVPFSPMVSSAIQHWID